MKKIENVAYGNAHQRQVLDIYLPEGEVKAAFLYFHGGGLAKGDKRAAERPASYLVEQGVAVFSANYRLYPEAKYPEFIHDAAKASAWVYNYITEKLSCDKLVIGGSSAGGYISMMLCFDPQYLTSAGLAPSKVSGYYHDAGQPTAHFNVLKERGVDPKRIIVDESAPLFHMGTQESYPPMRFIVSDNDMKNRPEQMELVVGTMNHFGYENFDRVIMHGTHCAYCGTLDENGVSVFGPMIWDFINKVL